jgi:hypothetical protein
LNPDRNDTSLLADAAKRLRSNPDYMAHALNEFQERAGIADEGLAGRLGTLPELVVRLALCKRPVLGSAGFADQVRDLSDYTLIDEDLLRRLIEGVEKPEAAARVHFPPAWFRDLFARHRLGVALALSVVALAAIGVLWWGSTRLQSGPTAGTQVAGVEPAGQPGRAPDTTRDQPQGSSGGETASPTPDAGGKPEEGKVARAVPPATSLVRIDLDDYAILRSGEAAPEMHQRIIAVPASVIRLSLNLPKGSDRGTYAVRLVGPYGESLVEAVAQSPTGRTIAVNLDFSAVAKNRYRLCVQLRSEPPDCYPIAIK